MQHYITDWRRIGVVVSRPCCHHCVERGFDSQGWSSHSREARGSLNRSQLLGSLPRKEGSLLGEEEGKVFDYLQDVSEAWSIGVITAVSSHSIRCLLQTPAIIPCSTCSISWPKHFRMGQLTGMCVLTEFLYGNRLGKSNHSWIHSFLKLNLNIIRIQNRRLIEIIKNINTGCPNNTE